MAKVRSPWRALRPLLLAGAVTATWLTLSASAATADYSRDSGSLLGGLTSSATSLTAPLSGAVSPILEAGSPAPSPAVPVVKSVVPAGTVSAVAVPIDAVVDNAADALIETVAAPLTEAAPVLEPVLKPVLDLVETTVPSSPVTLPGLLPLEEIAAGHITTDATTNSPGTSENLLTVTGMSPLPVPASTEMHAVLAESPWTADPATPPAPAGPASGAGSGASPSGPPGSAAWLDEFGLNLPLLGALPISGSPEHALSPVSFDPGSSPD
ncbi:UNVERIFIED_ORG: hypothetical protein ABIB52_000184 [Arthrobacter sp. UYCu721]